MSLPSQFAAGAVGLDTPTTGLCDITQTFTGTHTGVINVASGTACLINLNQAGAVNVAADAALSVTGGSLINGAITLVGARAFAFCNSSTIGAIKSSTAAGFIIIGSDGRRPAVRG